MDFCGCSPTSVPWIWTLGKHNLRSHLKAHRSLIMGSDSSLCFRIKWLGSWQSVIWSWVEKRLSEPEGRGQHLSLLAEFVGTQDPLWIEYTISRIAASLPPEFQVLPSYILIHVLILEDCVDFQIKSKIFLAALSHFPFSL